MTTRCDIALVIGLAMLTCSPSSAERILPAATTAQGAKRALTFPITFVETDEHKYYCFRIGDLDGDKRLDFLLTRGARQQEALDHNGHLLWRYEDPRASFSVLDPESEARIVDLDGDGMAEAVLPRLLDKRLCLCAVEGKSGRIKWTAPLPGLSSSKARRYGLTVARLRAESDRPELIMTWDHAWVGALNRRFELLWERREDLGQRTARAADIDNDGRDDVLCSATLIGPDGDIRWQRADLPTSRSIDSGSFRTSPVDSPQILDLDGNPANGLECVLSQGCWALSASGTPLWGLGERVVFGHHADVARVWSGKGGAGILLVDWADRGLKNGRRTVRLVDSRGRVRWTRNAEWGIFGDWDGDGLAEAFLGSGEVVNAYGRTVAHMPGFFANAIVTDVTGDGRDDLVIVNASTSAHTASLEVYTNPAPPSGPSAANGEAVPSKRLLNWSCY